MATEMGSFMMSLGVCAERCSDNTEKRNKKIKNLRIKIDFGF